MHSSGLSSRPVAVPVAVAPRRALGDISGAGNTSTGSGVQARKKPHAPARAASKSGSIPAHSTSIADTAQGESRSHAAVPALRMNSSRSLHGKSPLVSQMAHKAPLAYAAQLAEDAATAAGDDQPMQVDGVRHHVSRGRSVGGMSGRHRSASPSRRANEDGGVIPRRAPLTARGPSTSSAAALLRNRRDDLLVLDYQEAITKHLLESEEKHPLPPVDYMAAVQVEITSDMRGICLDWIVECATRFKMQTSTLFLAANILDRFLNAKPIRRERMQLVSMVCLIVAAKYEEVYPPRIHEYIHISANHFTQADLLRYEHYVLHALNYTLTVPTPFPFLSQYLTVLGANGGEPEPPSAKQLRDTSHFLAECSMLSLDLYLSEKASLMAAGSVHAARQMLGMTPVWPEEIASRCQWNSERVANSAERILTQVKAVRDGKLRATFNRYKDTPRSRISANVLAGGYSVLL